MDPKQLIHEIIPRTCPKPVKLTPIPCIPTFRYTTLICTYSYLLLTQIDSINLYLRAGPVTDLQYEPEGIGATWGLQDRLQQQVECLRAYSERVERLRAYTGEWYAYAPTRTASRQRRSACSSK